MVHYCNIIGAFCFYQALIATNKNTLTGVMEFGHMLRPRNFAIENKFSSEGFLANCQWQFSPLALGVGSGHRTNPRK